MSLTILCCAWYLTGEIHSSRMPWRSNTGVPFGNTNVDSPEGSEGSEASGFSSGAEFVEHQPELFGDLFDGTMDAEEGSAVDLQQVFPEAGAESHMGHNVAAAEPGRKRLRPSMDLDEGAGPDKRLFFSMLELQRPAVPKMPWDTGLVADVFKKGPCKVPMPWLSMPSVGKQESLKGLVPSSEPPERMAMRTPFHQKRLLTVRLAKTDDQLRAKALRRLRDLVLAVPVHTQLGRALLDTSGQLTGEDMIACVFADAFRSRATATLVKRSLDYYKLALWINHNMGLQPMQLTENVVYLYLNFLRESGAAPTSADAAVKAIWFMHSTVTIVDFNPKVFTSRITGVCRDMFLRKRILRQAPPFSADAVRALEEYALHAESRADSMFTNFILFCIFSSCRIGDASKIREVEFSRFHDIFLVEAATSEAKNTNTMERRRMLLPFTAIGWGLHFNPWCIKWEMQLKAMQPETIMPAFSEVSGQFLKRRITTAEANFWLREVLVRAGLTPEQAAKFSTHSCKATIPTWAGKFGGFSMDERRMLTHHMDANAVMPLSYSRDNLTALHSRVFRMLTAIRNFEFDPDASNAARIYQDNKDLLDEPVVPPQQPGAWDASESDVSEEDTFAESCNFVSAQSMPADTVTGQKLLHKDSLVVHVKRDGQTMWCGRKLSSNYRQWKRGDPDFSQLLVCQQCDKSQP